MSKVPMKKNVSTLFVQVIIILGPLIYIPDIVEVINLLSNT